MTEPLSHRHLVVYEAAGMEGEMATYLIRSLLSEGHVRYLTVEKTAEGLHERVIDLEGPTGLIVTTTRASLHPENETRMLSLTVTDTPEQTRSVFLPWPTRVTTTPMSSSKAGAHFKSGLRLRECTR